MATRSERADAAGMGADGSPLMTWYLRHFERHLPAIRESELLTTYFSTSYGDLYEYSSEFLRVIRLINESSDQESIAADAHRMGWKWYRVAVECDDYVCRDKGGKWVRMTKDQIVDAKDAESILKKIRDSRSFQSDEQKRDKEAAWAADNLVYIVSDRRGEMSRTTKEFAKVLPCYLFHVRYPNDCGDDLWTAHSFSVVGRTEEEVVYRICSQLHDFGGRVKSMLRQTGQVLDNPSLLKVDIDERRKTRSVDLGAVNSLSSNTSTKLTAASEFRRFLTERRENV